MTAPAPRNHPAEDDHSAPTPAPGAVLTDEALFDLLLELNEQGKEPTIAGNDADGRAFLSVLVEVGGDEVMPGLIWDDQHCRVYSLAGDHECETCGCPARHPVALNQAEYPVTVLAPRPEPVVAPLPSEAHGVHVEPPVGAAVIDRDGDVWQRRESGWTCTERSTNSADMPWSSIRIVCGPLRRLVPEDDEDTVRVPREAVVRLPLDAVLTGWTNGDETGWHQEFAYLEAEHAGRLDVLTTSIQETGIQVPIHLGADGRVWDGHHRLCAANRLALATVPVRIATEDVR